MLKTPDSAAEAVEAFQLTPQQQHLIREDHQNQKLWNEVLASLAEGPVCKGFLNNNVLILTNSEKYSLQISQNLIFLCNPLSQCHYLSKVI